MSKRPVYKTPPAQCDVCEGPITNAFSDANLAPGPWGDVCDACMSMYGHGYGIGIGQRYERQPDGRFMKTKG